MIFIQVVAYRDPQLFSTIRDCLEKARYKSDLSFGICWQRDETDNSLDAFCDDIRFRIDQVSWAKSEGLCWARSRVQKYYDGEAYTLQLDSHHRFTQDWDAQLLKFIQNTGSNRPILTSYAGMYSPDSTGSVESAPFKILAEKFTPLGTIFLRPQVIPEWQDLTRPIPARFVSGHFFFTLGSHCQEYRYDPSLYFAGDEISLSIRSFTLGYDLFHPHRTLIWHEYIRKGQVKHWDDHTSENKPLVGKAWHERDATSKRRLRKLLREEDNNEDLTGYDLGTVRTHGDYERYAGIDFVRRALHRDTLRGLNPPCSYTDEET